MPRINANHRAIYLDCNASAPVDAAVLAAMLPYFSAEYGNASSIHSFGQRARGAVERAREAVAALIHARPSEIVFTSGGTESNNAAIWGVVASARKNNPSAACHIITTTIEHHSVLHACQALQALHERRVEVTCVPVDSNGAVNPEDIRRALRPETVLITVMHANNELGTLQPIAEIGRDVNEAVAEVGVKAGVRFHTDAVQTAGKVPLDVSQLGVDLLAISGHKFGAPKGVGALYVRKGVRLEPLLHGGYTERNGRAGTENVPGIVGLGKAAELALAHMAENAARVAALRDQLETGLLARVPGARVNGASHTQQTTQIGRTPNTTCITFPQVDSESLVIALDLQGLACSAGAACSSGAVNPSHVLTAIGLSEAEARGTIRLSLSPANTEEEVARALEIIPAAVARQRELISARPELAPAQ